MKCEDLSYFPILGVDQMSIQNPWVGKILQAEGYVRFPRTVVIKIVRMCK
jgi:hypothetical protein